MRGKNKLLSKFCLIKARKMICGRRIVQGPVQTSHNSRFLRKYWIKLQNLHGFLNQHSNNLIHINIGSCQILTDPCAHAPRHTTLCWDWCIANILARNIMHMLLAGKQTSSHSAAQPSMASDADKPCSNMIIHTYYSIDTSETRNFWWQHFIN